MSQGFGENPYYGGGGGGFMPSPSQGSPGGGQRRSQKETLRPVSAVQLINATQAHPDAVWSIDNTEIGAVTIVGQAISVNPQATNTTYTIDDGYSPIEARHWKDASSEEEQAPTIQENDFVRVSGQLKVFGHKRYINATHVRKIVDFHEVYYHLLEVMAVTRTLEVGPPGAVTQQIGAGTGSASAYSVQATGAPSADAYNDLPPLQKSIIMFILAQPQSDDGIHVAAIARHCGGGDARAISEALDRLMDDGQVYTTINESHFAVSQ